MSAADGARASRLLAAAPDLLYNEALGLAHEGALHEARERLQAVRTLDPEMVDCHVVLGKVNAQLGHLPESIADLKRALELAPGHPAAQAAIARARELEQRARRGELRRRLARFAAGPLLLLVGLAAWPSYSYLRALLETTPVPVEEGVRQALREALGADGEALAVAPAGSSLVLSGEVDTELHRRFAVAVAQRAAPDLSVDGTAVGLRHPDPEAESLTRLLGLLGGDDLGAVTVSQTGATVTVAGRVPSEAHRHQLEELARSLPGVRGVSFDGLEVQDLSEHVVARGETLWELAEHYYGRGSAWPRIAAANRHLLPPDASLQIGERLRIPPAEPSPVGERLGAIEPDPAPP